MNQPQFKIHGSDRRKLKKEFSQLKSFVKNFWRHHQMDLDMASFYGGTEGYPMNDDKAKSMYDSAIRDVQIMEQRLSEPYSIK